MGDWLRKRRSERGLKQRELALMLQTSRDQIQAWERDEATPSAEDWRKLAEILGQPDLPTAEQPNSGA